MGARGGGAGAGGGGGALWTHDRSVNMVHVSSSSRASVGDKFLNGDVDYQNGKLAPFGGGVSSILWWMVFYCCQSHVGGGVAVHEVRVPGPSRMNKSTMAQCQARGTALSG